MTLIAEIPDTVRERVERLTKLEHLMTGMERRMLDAVRTNQRDLADVSDLRELNLTLRDVSYETMFPVQGSGPTFRISAVKVLDQLEVTYSYQLSQLP